MEHPSSPDAATLQALQARIVAAVQAELDRHAGIVANETQKLRGDAIRERDDLRRHFGEQLTELADAVRDLSDRQGEIRRTLEEQVVERHSSRATAAAMVDLETRLGRRVEQVTTNLDALVDGSVRPHLDAVRDQHEVLTQRVEVLDGDLRAFDEQAARLVVYVNEVISKLDGRVGDAAVSLRTELETRLDGFDGRIEEISAASLRQHVDTSKLVNERAERLEERLSLRLSSIEGSLREELGSRLADVDAHLGRVSSGLDDTLNVLGDRINALERTVEDLDARMLVLRREVDGSGSDVIDDLKEKVSAAAGEAMLVRIDFERFQESAGERVESVNARLATVESQLADATMDVSTAIQLERLEELERAVMELDPQRVFSGALESGGGDEALPADGMAEAVVEAEPEPVPESEPEIEPLAHVVEHDEPGSDEPGSDEPESDPIDSSEPAAPAPEPEATTGRASELDPDIIGGLVAELAYEPEPEVPNQPEPEHQPEPEVAHQPEPVLAFSLPPRADPVSALAPPGGAPSSDRPPTDPQGSGDGLP